MMEYRFRISGVHYAANPEAEAGMPDTEEMHVRTREMLSWIDHDRPLVSLFAEPTNIFNPDCIMAVSRGTRIGRVADECLRKVKSIMAESGETIHKELSDVLLRDDLRPITPEEQQYIGSVFHKYGYEIKFDRMEEETQ